MEATPVKHNLYRNSIVCLLIVASILNLALTGVTAFSLPHPDLGLLLFICVGTYVLLLAGGGVLFLARKEDRSLIRLSLWGGLLFGVIIGVLMAIVASGPNEAALGVGLITLVPVSFLYLYGSIFAKMLALLPHLVMLSVLGGSAFWIARLSGKVRFGIGSALLTTCVITCFTIIAGFAMTFVLGRLDLLYIYGGWGMLFVLPFPILLLYTLIFGTAGAWLGRLNARRTAALAVQG